jgi:glycosyltransferase involved in cell wall biosynthesis
MRAGIASAVFAHRGSGALEETLRGDCVDFIAGAPEESEFHKAVQRALDWRPDVIHIHREGPADPRTGYIMRAVRESPRNGSSAPVGIMETNVFGRVDYSTDAACVDVHFLLSKWCFWKWRQWARPLRPMPIGVVLPNLVMHEEFYPVTSQVRNGFRQKLGIPDDALLFGRVGSPIESKWSNAMLEAFEVYASTNPNAWLLLVGISTELRAVVAALPEFLRRRIVSVDFLSGNPALREAYSSMDVFLHTARIGESFGMVLAEALLCGTPVITLSTPTKDNSQLEVVGHEQGGLVAASVPGLVQAMSQLESPQLRSRYALEGARRIAERFGPRALIPRAIAIAALCRENLPRDELRRRVLSIPGVQGQVSRQEIDELMRGCIGKYPPGTSTLLHLVSNPTLYRAYRALSRP